MSRVLHTAGIGSAFAHIVILLALSLWSAPATRPSMPIPVSSVNVDFVALTDSPKTGPAPKPATARSTATSLLPSRNQPPTNPRPQQKPSQKLPSHRKKSAITLVSKTDTDSVPVPDAAEATQGQESDLPTNGYEDGGPILESSSTISRNEHRQLIEHQTQPIIPETSFYTNVVAGSLNLNIEIDQTGKPSLVHVTSGSGDKALDAAYESRAYSERYEPCRVVICEGNQEPCRIDIAGCTLEYSIEFVVTRKNNQIVEIEQVFDARQVVRNATTLQ